MPRYPNTPEAYVEMVEQALFEIDEVRASLEYDNEGMDPRIFNFIDTLESELRQIRAGMADGSYTFGYRREDLPYMEWVAGQDPRALPFKQLLEDINHVHRYGLAVDPA